MSDTLPVPLLAVRGLTIRFRGEDGFVDAVKGIDFDLYPSEILAIVGESGSGKSATALSVPGLLPGDAETGGAVLFDGENLLEEDAGALAELRGGRIAMIFQDPAAALDPVFSIGHQIGEALKLHEPALPAAQRRARALELLTQVGLDRPETRMGRYPHEFSGGQLQRIMIAMALAGRPELLIADEPTTALDVTVQQDILDLLYRLNREEGMAILLITHDMGVVADIASRVIVLHHGRVVETATVGDLFDAPKEAYTQRLLAAVPNGDADAGLPVNDTPPLLEVRDLHLGYSSGFGRRTEVVKGVSFGIGAGEFLGLVGESGSGKTTIGRSLIGLVKPLQGHIRLAGQDVHRGKALSGRIGAVFQNPAGSLNPRLTISRSIAEPILPHGSVPRGELQSRVDALLESVGIPAAWRHRYPSELSGGQRQRVAIARALALDPVLLVADEPTSALDVSVQDDILKLLRRLQQERQFACLFISHDLAVVRGLCRNVVVLHRGEVVEAGPSTTVLDTPATDYTRRLVTSAPLPDPAIQARRRQARTGLFPADFAAVVRPAALKETVTTSV